MPNKAITKKIYLEQRKKTGSVSLYTIKGDFVAIRKYFSPSSRRSIVKDWQDYYKTNFNIIIQPD